MGCVCGGHTGTSGKTRARRTERRQHRQTQQYTDTAQQYAPLGVQPVLEERVRAGAVLAARAHRFLFFVECLMVGVCCLVVRVCV